MRNYISAGGMIVIEREIRIPSLVDLDFEIIDEILVRKGIWFMCPFCDNGVYQTRGHLINHLKWKHFDELIRIGAA